MMRGRPIRALRNLIDWPGAEFWRGQLVGLALLAIAAAIILTNAKP